MPFSGFEKLSRSIDARREEDMIFKCAAQCSEHLTSLKNHIVVIKWQNKDVSARPKTSSQELNSISR